MHKHHPSMILLFALTFGASVMGCAGELPPGISIADSKALPPLYFDTAPSLDQGGTQPSIDSGIPSPDTTTPSPDTTTPSPDTTTPSPDTGSGGVGLPCPCPNGLYCIFNACRPPCNQPPTDPCRAISDCAANEACLPTSQPAIWICMPATTLGAPCSQNIYCPNHAVCASINNAPEICIPICNVVGQSCGAGGTCLDAGNGCLVCSKP